MRICPNDKFIEIFAQKSHYFEDPFYKFFALNLLFQGTSCSFALKYSNFLVKFFSFAFYNINFWFEISKICPKISHFSQISHSRGNTGQHRHRLEVTVKCRWRYITVDSVLILAEFVIITTEISTLTIHTVYILKVVIDKFKEV